MRITKEFVETLSKKVVRSLTDKDLIIWEETIDKLETIISGIIIEDLICLLYTSPSPRDGLLSRMPSSA